MKQVSQKKYSDLYHPHILTQEIFPGVSEAINQIHDEYPLIFVISSARTDTIKAYLDHHGLLPCFTRLLGWDVHPKKAVKMVDILTEYEANPANTVLITDTLGDIREAASISVGSIAVSWGYQDAADLLTGNPYRLIDAPAQLPDAIRDYFERRAE